MVSYFGEVVFPSSRAFWDDEDEYEPIKNAEHHLKLSTHWTKSKPEDVKKFIVIEGNPLISLVEECMCLCDEYEVCVVEDENNKKIAIIYETDEQVFTCIILTHFDTRNAGLLIQDISDMLLNAKNIVAVVWNNVSQFFSMSKPDDPFLRVLSTKTMNISNDCNMKLLEQPNIVSGVGAGVLSYAKLVDIPTELYVLYTDGFTLEPKAIELTLQVLSKELHRNLKCRNFMESFFYKGNLYM